MITTVKIWDAATGRQLSDLRGHTERQSTVLATLLTEKLSPQPLWIKLSKYGMWQPVVNSQTYEDTLEPVLSVSYSPDGKTIATASDDKTVIIWDVATGSQLSDLLGHTEAVLSASYSPDGQTIATASEDRTVKTWTAVTGSHTKSILSVSYSPDGKNYCHSLP